MTELMIKMTFWLVAAMLLGFIVAWFLSRVIYKRKQYQIEKIFDRSIVEQNNIIDELEKKIRKKREAFENVSNELEDSKGLLAEKTSLLTKVQHNLTSSHSSKSLDLKLQEENSLLSIENKKLKEIDNKRVMELKSFEEVLLLAEDRIEENEKLHFQVVENLNEENEILILKSKKYKENIKIYEKRIKKLDEKLKLYKAKSVDSEFIITQDQFISIEEQLRKYQKEIRTLENLNRELLQKFKKSDRKIKV